MAVRAKGRGAVASQMPSFGPMSSTDRMGVTVTVQYRVGDYHAPHATEASRE
jgi:hypothetical protein